MPSADLDAGLEPKSLTEWMRDMRPVFKSPIAGFAGRGATRGKRKPAGADAIGKTVRALSIYRLWLISGLLVGAALGVWTGLSLFL